MTARTTPEPGALRLLLSSIKLLAPIKWKLLRLLGLWAIVGAAMGLLSLSLITIFWSGVLAGEPLSAWQAHFVGMSATQLVEVEQLSKPLRHALLKKLILFRGVPLSLLVLFFVLCAFYYQVLLLQQVNQHLRGRLMARLFSLSLSDHAEGQTGDAIYRVYQDSAVVTQVIEVLLLTPLQTLARYGAALFALLLFDPMLSLLVALAWPLTLALGAFFSGRLRTRFQSARIANSALTAHITERLLSVQELKAYGLETREQQAFETRSLKALDEAFVARNLYALLVTGVFFCIATLALIALYKTTWASATGAPIALAQGNFKKAAVGLGMTAWNLGLYNASKFLFGQSTSAVQRIYQDWGRAQDIIAGLRRTFALLEQSPKVVEAKDAIAMPPLREDITFESVSFNYGASLRPALSDIDLRLPMGSITAIVGPTGAGKSTLVSLLLRLFDPDRGNIRIDGQDLKRFSLFSLREKIAIVLQENQLFSTSAKENIRYAVPQASDKAVEQAARIACAHEFIEALPNGYDQQLGERGRKLSTGQRQRLSIARALLKDPDVLVLDEPTAALDPQTERALMDNLAKLAKSNGGKIIILITHRPRTAAIAEQIVFLSEGQIIERGTHESLTAESGAYKALFEVDA